MTKGLEATESSPQEGRERMSEEDFTRVSLVTLHEGETEDRLLWAEAELPRLIADRRTQDRNGFANSARIPAQHRTSAQTEGPCRR